MCDSSYLNTETSRHDLEMARSWMDAHPKLAVEGILAFVAKHSRKFNITLHLSPTENFLTLTAKAEGQKPIATMTKQHFEFIAEVLRENWKFRHANLYDAELLQLAFADALTETNPNFNRPRFLAACRGED